MSLVFLSLSIAVLWANLVGAGLAARRWVGDYGVARVCGAIAFCLVCFSLEHLEGWGPHPPLLPFTTVLSVLLVWKHRASLREHLGYEALFGLGFAYCLAWRYAFPDIDFTGEKMPNLAMIEGYMRGVQLPAPDLWLPPFRANFYYNFQHYAAALMGRIMDLGAGETYHLAYCVMGGFIALGVGACARGLCGWRAGRVALVGALMFGGSGTAVVAHAVLERPTPIQSVRFLGGSVVHERDNPWGVRLAQALDKPGIEPRDLPMEPLAYVLTNGDYHPPLAGYVLLSLAVALIALNAAGATGSQRKVHDGLLAATLPLVLISNAWVFPLQLGLVLGWFAFRSLSGERGFWLSAFAGVVAATFLEYPYLIEFTQQSIGSNASVEWTAPADRTPLLGWVITFSPALGMLLLGLVERDRRRLSLFFVVVWSLELLGTEFFFNHDVYGGVWSRFNTTMKWWPWVYAGVFLTQGAINLGSSSRLCRYGAMALIVPTLWFGVDTTLEFARTPKPSKGHLSGSAWLERDIVVKDLIADLKSRPDGITLESGLTMANSEAPAVALFAGKPALMGWPWHETTWRGSFLEIRTRQAQIDSFYNATLEDPLRWLLRYDVRYVVWMQRDNVEQNAHFAEVYAKIKPRYLWHNLYGDGHKLAIGYWERLDHAPAN